MDLTVQPGFCLKCYQCKKSNYDSWKLIGVAVDQATQIVKLTLPYVMCEPCFRKRFCSQLNPKYVCGIAVFPSVDNSAQNDKLGNHHVNNPLSSVDVLYLSFL